MNEITAQDANRTPRVPQISPAGVLQSVQAILTARPDKANSAPPGAQERRLGCRRLDAATKALLAASKESNIKVEGCTELNDAQWLESLSSENAGSLKNAQVSPSCPLRTKPKVRSFGKSSQPEPGSAMARWGKEPAKGQVLAQAGLERQARAPDKLDLRRLQLTGRFVVDASKPTM
eukprot:gnl/MRDRNA2_/MRDRNA2_140298_c0_seq1.p1 gnl/MRDRNA2_/MRDRNA2_140298_c0~~gnl/MRDRNA2_/MRDRNA2_140298_c0_seq1.p1  ORF type:complete len:177 (+),score=32.74 gnl/MRDRNA2_/MRDRNA2_140298_c0_seq1:69-599(+)